MRIRFKRPEPARAVIRGIDGRDGVDGESPKPCQEGKIGRPGIDGARGEIGPRGIQGEKGERGLRGPQGKAGQTGEPGLDGWSPIPAVVEDGQRRVYQVIGWVGGEGEPPRSGWYIGPRGPVDRIADATDIRGPQGTPGAFGVVTRNTASTGAMLGVPTYILASVSDPLPSGPAIAYVPTGVPGQYTLEIIT